MLKYIDGFKSISLHCKIGNDLYYVNCYKILGTRDLKCNNRKELLDKFKPTTILYKLKLLRGYYHDYKNLFVFNNKLIRTQYIKNFQLFKAFVKRREKLKNMIPAYDLIPVFVELYNEQKKLLTFLDQKHINNLYLTLTLNGITFRKYRPYQILTQRAKQNQSQIVQYGKYINFSVLFGSYGEIRQINAYIKLKLEDLYKLLNVVY